MSNLAPVRQGAVNYNALYDAKGVREAIEASRAGNPVYPGGEEAKNQGMYAHEIAVALTANQGGGGKPLVFTTVNAQMAEEARTSAGNREWVAYCFRNRITVQGVVLLPLLVPECNTNPAAALQTGGLALVPAVADTRSGNGCTPGDAAMCEMPLGVSYDQDRNNPTTPAASSRAIVRVRPRDSKSVARRLVVMLQKAATNTELFQAMLGPGLRNTDGWMTTTKYIQDFLAISGLLHLWEYVDAGVVDVSEHTQRGLDAFRVDGNPAAAPIAEGGTATQGARLAAYIAARMYLVVPRDTNGATLPPAASAHEELAWLEMRARLQRMSAPAPGDAEVAFGMFTQRAALRPDGVEVDADGRRATMLTTLPGGRVRVCPYGQLYAAQLDGLNRFAAALYQAQRDDDRMRLGVIMSGQSPDNMVVVNLQPSG